jgi:glycosyltransferase involved in cell wall biosynthesis
MSKNILILYAEVMPYNIPVYRILVENGYSLTVIQLDHLKLTPFSSSELEAITFKGISDFDNYNEFISYCTNINPCLVFVSEVMNLWYWKAARNFKKDEKIHVILGSDAQWTGSKNNWIKRICSKFTYHLCFSHIFVAGLWQCEYARKIGFRRSQISFPLYSANTDLYQKVSIENKKEKYPKRFLYVGRFHPNKGISYLFEAWKQINDKDGWGMTVIGNGPLENYVLEQENIEVLDFQSQEKICELMNGTGCAIVPSIFEPWGLVIHEAAAAGLPIIVTSNCGATNQFVIDKYNGYIINERSVEDLKNAMMKIIETSKEELLNMSERSRCLSYRVTPEITAYSLLSLIN